MLPFCFHPVLIFSNLINTLPHCLCTDGMNFSIQIIVDNGQYLGSTTDVLMSWEPTINGPSSSLFNNHYRFLKPKSLLPVT